MRYIGIIPARLGSTRFPNKPLADICGKPMIQHVYERAKECLDIVYVATDHTEIFDIVHAFGGKAVMTSVSCKSGTDRCWLAYCKIRKLIPFPKVEGLYEELDIIINIQGDQPLLHYNHIETIKDCFRGLHSLPEVATVACLYDTSEQEYANEAFVAIDINHNAMYFSRYTIPADHKRIHRKVYKHIGVYGFTVQALCEFFDMEQRPLEVIENLEQNRWLENGKNIKVGLTNHPSISVDIEKELLQVRQIVKQQENEKKI